MVTYAQYQAAQATLKRLSNGNTTLDSVYTALGTLKGDDKKSLISALKILGSVENPTELKSQHQAVKTKYKAPQIKAQEPVKTMKITYKVVSDGIKSAIVAGVSGNVKSLLSADAAIAVDQVLQESIVERARMETGMFSEITMIPMTSINFRPAPVALTNAQVAKIQETDGTLGYTMTATDTGALVQPISSLSGFESSFSVSREVFTDVKIDIIGHVNDAIGTEMLEQFATELAVGDNSLAELSGVMTDHLDIANGYADSLLAKSVRNFNIFGAMKSGLEGELGNGDTTAAKSVVDNIKDLIAMLPAKLRSEAKFYMHSNTFNALSKMKDSSGRPLYSGKEIEGQLVVLDDTYPVLGSDDSDAVIGFGVPDKAMGLGLVDTLDNVNPFTYDGLIKYGRKSRLLNWIKDNTAMVFLLAKV